MDTENKALQALEMLLAATRRERQARAELVYTMHATGHIAIENVVVQALSAQRAWDDAKAVYEELSGRKFP